MDQKSQHSLCSAYPGPVRGSGHGTRDESLAMASAAVSQGKPTFLDTIVLPWVRGVRKDGLPSSFVTPVPG